MSKAIGADICRNHSVNLRALWASQSAEGKRFDEKRNAMDGAVDLAGDRSFTVSILRRS